MPILIFICMAKFDRNYLSHILRESLESVLNESLSDKIYHFTGIRAAYRILKDNSLFCQSMYAGGMSDNNSDKYKFYVSFSRNKNTSEGFATSYSKEGARIEFDGRLLNQRFAGGSFNYWGAGERLNKYNYMRKASGMEDWYEYNPTNETPDPSQVVNVKKVPHATKYSPLYINYKGKIAKKSHHNNSEAPSHAYRYIPIKNGANYNGAPTVGKDDYDFKYPNQLSPDYVTVDGKLYGKEMAIPHDIQQHHDFEFEDRLLTNKSVIEGIRDYIKRVDILIVEPFESLTDDIRRIVYAMSQMGICFIYDNQKDFDRQSDNTINQSIRNIDKTYKKYNGVILDEPKVQISNMSNMLTVFAYANHIVDWGERCKFAGSILKKYGLDRYIRPVISDMRHSFGDVNSLSDAVLNITHQPSKEGQIFLSIVHELFRKGGWKNWRDIKAAMDSYSFNRSKYENINTSMTLERRVLSFDRWHVYDITDDELTDFWHIFQLDGKRGRYDFIENIISDLNYDYGTEWTNAIRDRNVTMFTKYLQSLAHRKVTLNEMLGLMSKIGVGLGEICVAASIRGIPEIKSVILDYFDYTSPSTGIKMPYKTAKDDYEATDDYACKIFAKKN